MCWLSLIGLDLGGGPLPNQSPTLVGVVQTRSRQSNFQCQIPFDADVALAVKRL